MMLIIKHDARNNPMATGQHPRITGWQEVPAMIQKRYVIGLTNGQTTFDGNEYLS